jgi:hypothetical protein
LDWRGAFAGADLGADVLAPALAVAFAGLREERAAAFFTGRRESLEGDFTIVLRV